MFKKFTAPKTIRELEGAEQGARATLEYQELRLQRQLDRLATLEKQVERCTIRAPHDGFVIYANNADRELFIEPGIPVRERQPLFFLPDLDDMEVVAMLHESIVDQVGSGMRATVYVEGLSDRRIEGHVTKIATMPLLNWRSDVKYFEGIVRLENVPSGLRPGMSAEVKIALPRVENVLAVPSDAVRFENGHDFCFVAHEDGLERREVKLGQVTSDLSEVTEGLEEGEQVVINPPKQNLELEDSPAGADLTCERIGARARFIHRCRRRIALIGSNAPSGADESGHEPDFGVNEIVAASRSMIRLHRVASMSCGWLPRFPECQTRRVQLYSLRLSIEPRDRQCPAGWRRPALRRGLARPEGPADLASVPVALEPLDAGRVPGPGRSTDPDPLGRDRGKPG